MLDSEAPIAVPTKPVLGRRLWLWFAAGFLAAFAGLLIFYPISFYNGRGVYETVLWRYYLWEFKQQAESSGALGPTSGGTTGLVVVAVEHVTIAAVGGFLAALIAKLLRSRRGV